MSACAQGPSILFMVSDEAVLSEDQNIVWVERGDDRIRAKQGLKLEAGDRIVMEEGVDGLSARTIQTVSTAIGPATLLLSDDYLAQQSGSVLHEAEGGGTLVLPGFKVLHSSDASYLVELTDETVQIVTFSGSATVSSDSSAFPPFFINEGEKRRIWRGDNRLSPSRPMESRDLNTWLAQANKLLTIAGDKTRLVPYVLGLPAADGEGVVSAAKLKKALTFDFKDQGEERLGNILTQSPPAGRRVGTRSAVRITIKSRPVKLPVLTGMSFERAKSELAALDLEAVNAGRSITGKFDEFRINSQTPAAGELVAERSKVRLVEEAPSVAVPSVTNMTEAQARQRLQSSRGLTLERQTDLYAVLDSETVAGNTSRQSPVAGTLVAPGSSVQVWIVEQGYLVPNVGGLTTAAARSLLQKENFESIETIRQNSTSPVDQVIAQTPTANTLQRSTDTVTIFVSQGMPASEATE